jgi:hypothetical protein
MQTVRTRKGLELVRSALFDELDPETIQIHFRPVVPPLEEEELQAAEEELQPSSIDSWSGGLSRRTGRSGEQKKRKKIRRAEEDF